MKIYKLQNDEFRFEEVVVPSIKDRSESLAGWIDLQNDYEINVVTSEFKFHLQNYSHYLVTFKTKTGKEFAGHGRSPDPYLAFLKGFSEAIERLSMSLYFQEMGDSDTFIQRRISASCGLTPATFDTRFPPNERLYNSNGWAVHSTLSDAFKRAFHEALERHSMQLRYWTEGLSFLKPVKVINEGPYRIELSEIDAGFGGLKTVTASLSSSPQRGRLFGHSVVESLNTESWLHPQIEAFQIAESIKYSTEAQEAENVFDLIQRDFWFTDKFAPAQSNPIPPPVVDSLDLNVVALDLKKTFDLPIEFFACWTFSDSIMPLFLEPVLSEKNKQIFCQQYFFIKGTENALCQTPFI